MSQDTLLWGVFEVRIGTITQERLIAVASSRSSAAEWRHKHREHTGGRIRRLTRGRGMVPVAATAALSVSHLRSLARWNTVKAKRGPAPRTARHTVKE